MEHLPHIWKSGISVSGGVSKVCALNIHPLNERLCFCDECTLCQPLANTYLPSYIFIILLALVNATKAKNKTFM